MIGLTAVVAIMLLFWTLSVLNCAGVSLCLAFNYTESSFHSRKIFAMTLTRRMMPSKRITTAIWRLGLLKTLSFLPNLFNARAY